MRPYFSRLRAIVILFPLHRHGGGKYSAAVEPSRRKIHVNDSPTPVQRARPHDAGVHVQKGTELYEAEEESVGVMIVDFTSLLCSVSGAAWNTALSLNEVRRASTMEQGRLPGLPLGTP